MKQTIRLLLKRAPLVWALLLALGSSRAMAQITNDDCGGAVALTTSSVCTVPVNGTVAGATQSQAPTAACGPGLTTANDVWYSFTASSSIHLVTLAPRFAAILDVRSGTCASNTSVFCTTIANNNTAAVSVGGLVGGQPYLIRIYPASNTPPTGISSTFALCIGQGSTGPANDDCAGALNVPVSTTGTCTTQVSADNTLATGSAGVPAPTCANYNGRDVWFSVTVPASGNVTVQTVVSTTGTDIGDTGMSMYSGTCGNLTQLGCSDDEGDGNKSLLAFTGRTPGEVLYVRAWSWSNQRSGNIAVCATSPPPLANDNCAGAIAVPVTATCATPVSGTIAGATQSLPPTASCGGTVANDVWYSFVASGPTQLVTVTAGFTAVADVRSGPCATSASVFCGNAFSGQPLTVTGLSSGQPYFLRLYLNGTFTPTNPQFTLCINPGPTPPANDDCTGATAVPIATSCAAPISGTVAAASQSLPPTANCGGTAANDVWYSFVANGNSQTIAFSGTFGAVLDVRTGTCASSTSVFCTTTFTGQSVTATGLVNGQAYFLRVYANSTVTPVNPAFTLCITAGPPPSVNDECSTAVAVAVVQGCTTSTNGTVANATQSLPPTANCGAGVTTAADVWYSFAASAPTQLITLTTRFGAVMEVRSGSCANSASLLCTSVFANATSGTVVGGLTPNQQYYIRIYANGANQPTPANATFTLCVSPAPTPPVNDECAGAVAVPVTAACAAPVSGSVEAASQSLPTASCASATTPVAQDVWYSFVASGATQLITLNSRFAAVVDVRSGPCTASTSVSCYSVFANTASGTLVGGLTNGQTYFLRVYASGNTQPAPLSATFTLCINPGPPPPANDECTSALPVTASTTNNCGTPVSGTVENASQSLPAATGCGGGTGSAADVWYSFVAGNTAHNVLLNPSQGNFVFEVRSGTCAASTSLFCSTVFAGAAQPVMVNGLTPGQTYFIRVYSTAATPPVGAAAGFTLCLSTPPPPPANDECAGALPLPVQVGTTCVSQTTTDNTSATSSATLPLPGCAGAGTTAPARDVWFQLTVPASGTLTVRTVVPTTGTDVGDTGMAMYAGSCGNLTLLGCSDDEGGALKSQLTFNGRTPGEVLYVRVWAFYANQSGTLAVCATTPPVCAAPTALASSNITLSTAQLDWQPGGTPAAGTTYTVEYGLQGFTPGTGTTVTGLTSPSTQLTALNPSTTYCFYVRQNCPGGNGSSPQTGPSCFTTTTPVCVAPTALASSNVTNTSAQLSWQPGGTPAAGTTYTVEYGLQGFTPGSGTVLAGLTSPGTQLTALNPGTAYCFYVRQNCPGGNGSSTQTGPSCFTTTAPVCAVPTSGTAGTLTTTSAQLSWQPGGTPAAGTTYTIEYGLQGFTPGTGTTVASLSGPTYLLSGLTAGTQYCYYVRQNCPAPSGSSAFAGPFCFQTVAAPVQPANDDPCGAVTLGITAAGGPLQPVSGTTVGATTSGQPGIALPACGPATTAGDVWFSMTPAAGTTSVRLTIAGAPAGMVRVFTAANCTTGPFTLVSCQSSGAANTAVGPLTLTGLTPGQRYYVAVSGYANADTPGAFTIAGSVVTAARVQAESSSLLVFPNPSSSGQLTVRLSGLRGGLQATLLNALGQVVLSQPLPSGTTEQVLNTRGLATGLYTLRVAVGDEVLTRKVVLE
ncbi:fibronectin type III domain-containing protein [Hymenobacter ruricola]|uniref:T9SS type A sorting domain-containing protein n=1 Tax=Hymenobacter ruricola TaxID=2791023 RepID=A0ABS0HZS8_9BACT|nr:T9SS type A sorting domain-containing protein [Hymenobacter ruricola]MBF9220041.1 T9SS type A sorting domain-containing protein [Hymenobacter ruricola]